jgi:sec-independent protein translocase protein TatA
LFYRLIVPILPEIFFKTGDIMHFGMTELLIILAIIVILFGAKKIPDLARGLGQSVHLFKKGIDEAEEESEKK